MTCKPLTRFTFNPNFMCAYACHTLLSLSAHSLSLDSILIGYNFRWIFIFEMQLIGMLWLKLLIRITGRQEQ